MSSRKWWPLLMAMFFSLPCTAQKVTIRGKRLSLAEVLRQIHEQAGYSYMANTGTLDDAPFMDLDCRNTDVGQVLSDCFAGLQFRFIIKDSAITVFSPGGPGANIYKPLKGLVQNLLGQPLEGASVIVEGAPRAITGKDGGFSFPVKGLQTVVTISFEGYVTTTVSLSNKELKVVRLQPSASVLDQVVIQAYGKTTPRLTTGSVSQVSMDEAGFQAAGNLQEALEGRVPGMAIRQYNGVPGSAYGILIRGRHSISQGTDPLVVINGVPIVFNDGYQNTIGTGSAQGPTGASIFNGIPLSAIASIEILKDAAATAIYGSRGANGVVLLTLKTGRAGQLKWDAKVSSGFDQVVKTSPLLNTSQYLALRKEAVLDDGMPVNAVTVPELNWDSSRNTNFKRLVRGGAPYRQSVGINLSGGDTNTMFFASGTRDQQASVFPGNTGDEKQSLYGQLQHQSKNLRFQLDLLAFYSREENRLPIEDYSYAMYLAPNAPPFFSASGQPMWSSNGIDYLNIPALQNDTYHAHLTDQFNQLLFTYNALPGLKLRCDLGYYRIGSAEHSQELIAGQDPATAPTGQTSYTGTISSSEQVEGLAEYSGKMRRAQLETILGVTWQGQQSDYSMVNATGYTSDLALGMGSGNPTIVMDGNSAGYRYAAVFGRVNYMLDHRYIATISGRRDGSSRFGPGNRAGNFWAVSGAWIFSDEAPFKKWNWLSFGKWRASLGTTGNDQINDNNIDQQYAATNSARGYQGLQGVVPVNLANPDLRWEVNYKSELALDLGFFRNRVLLSAAAYRDWTVNQVVYTALASQSGLPGVFRNVPATIVNIGLEFSLQTEGFSIGELQWVSVFRVTVPVNRLASFPDLSLTSLANTLVVGQSLSVIKGFHYEGVNPVTGLFRFRTFNGDGIPTARDLQTGGNLDLRYYGGSNQSIRYRNWQLDLFFEFRVQKGFNPYVTLYEQNPPGIAGPLMLGNGPVGWLDHWHKPGDHALLQRVTQDLGSAAWAAIYNYISSDAQAIDASFIRWKGLSLAYQLPKKRLGAIREVKIYLRGENLLTFTHFPVADPETQNPTVLPPIRSVVAGVKMGF